MNYEFLVQEKKAVLLRAVFFAHVMIKIEKNCEYWYFKYKPPVTAAVRSEVGMK